LAFVLQLLIAGHPTNTALRVTSSMSLRPALSFDLYKTMTFNPQMLIAGPPNQHSLEGNLFRVALACFVLRHPIRVLTIQPVHHSPNHVPCGRNLHTRCSGSIVGMLLIDVRVSWVLWSWGGVTSPPVLSRVLLDVTPTLGFNNPPITPVQSGGSSHDTFARNGRSCPRLCSRNWSVDPRACSAR
jgi:hypothetical protein